jgi:hypothetical protein
LDGRDRPFHGTIIERNILAHRAEPEVRVSDK